MIKPLLLISVLLTSSVTYSMDASVSRVLTQERHKVTAADPYIKFSREVCTKEDLTVVVYKQFENVHTGEFWPDTPPNTYGIYGRDKCFVMNFSVRVPDNLPAGYYKYIPLASMTISSNGKSTSQTSADSKVVLVNLPSEQFDWIP